MLGGGTHLVPGEVRLSYNGVLFLDELPEFQRSVLEVMRQPLEELNFSARAYDRILKVSRTISDIAASEEIPAEYVQEVIRYRPLDRNFWV